MHEDQSPDGPNISEKSNMLFTKHKFNDATRTYHEILIFVYLETLHIVSMNFASGVRQHLIGFQRMVQTLKGLYET